MYETFRTESKRKNMRAKNLKSFADR